MRRCADFVTPDRGVTYALVGAFAVVRPVSVAVHIGSQLADLAPFRAAFARVAELVTALRADGHPISRIDLGGGLGIAYRDETPPSAADYAAMVDETVGHLGCEQIGRASCRERVCQYV